MGHLSQRQVPSLDEGAQLISPDIILSPMPVTVVMSLDLMALIPSPERRASPVSEPSFPVFTPQRYGEERLWLIASKICGSLEINPERDMDASAFCAISVPSETSMLGMSEERYIAPAGIRSPFAPIKREKAVCSLSQSAKR